MPEASKYKNIDLTGQRHGRLTAIKRADFGITQWVCKCDCGTIKIMPACRFFSRKSCGCLEAENRKSIGARSKTHGMTSTILYSKYCSMKERCHNPHYKYYNRYGGRGVKICDEWEKSFESFAKWAYENGYDETKTGYDQSLDRINLDGDYCPENCRWTNQKEQVRNRSISVKMMYNGKETTPCEFAKEHGITNETYIYRKLKKGESAEDILYKWNMLNNTPSEYMKIQEASQYYNVSEASIRKWLNKGLIKGLYIEQRWYIFRGQDAPIFNDRNERGQFLKRIC